MMVHAPLDPTLLEAGRHTPSGAAIDGPFQRHTSLGRINALEPFEVLSESDGHDGAMTDLLAPNETDVSDFGH
jgi:hypothetical protein